MIPGAARFTTLSQGTLIPYTLINTAFLAARMGVWNGRRNDEDCTKIAAILPGLSHKITRYGLVSFTISDRERHATIPSFRWPPAGENVRSITVIDENNWDTRWDALPPPIKRSIDEWKFILSTTVIHWIIEFRPVFAFSSSRLNILIKKILKFGWPRFILESYRVTLRRFNEEV